MLERGKKKNKGMEKWRRKKQIDVEEEESKE